MELEKSKKVGMENKRGLSLNVVMFVILVVVQFAFTYPEKETNAESLGSVATSNNEEMISITRHEEVEPPSPAAIEILNIVIDGTKINDNHDVVNSEATKDAKVEILVVQIPTQEKEIGDDEVYVVVEIMPVFPGGELAMRKFIARAIKYPTSAEEKGIQGKVFVRFVVDKDGSVSNAKIARGVEPSIDKEALRVIMSLPKWKPGMQHGKAVSVSFMVPISFQLQLQ